MKSSLSAPAVLAAVSLLTFTPSARSQTPPTPSQPPLPPTLAPVLVPTPTPAPTNPDPNAPKSRPVDISHLMKAPPAADTPSSGPFKASCNNNGKNYKKGEAGYDSCLVDSTRESARRGEKAPVQDPANGPTVSVDFSGK